MKGVTAIQGLSRKILVDIRVIHLCMLICIRTLGLQVYSRVDQSWMECSSLKAAIQEVQGTPEHCKQELRTLEFLSF
jgi:hypothetical protein